MKLMSYLKYDAATMGNHDFDAGLDGFLKAHQHANFPFLCANYDFTNTVLNDITQSNVIVDKGQIKVGIFGIGVELKGLVPDEKFGNTVYLDPIVVANEQASILKKQGCDLVICLSHLGFEHAWSDSILGWIQHHRYIEHHPRVGDVRFHFDHYQRKRSLLGSHRMASRSAGRYQVHLGAD